MTMEVKVPLDADSMNDAIMRCAVESQLGVALKESIEKFLANDPLYGSSFTKTMQAAVDGEIKKIIVNLLRHEYADAIRDKVREKISDKAVDDLVGRAIDKLLLD